MVRSQSFSKNQVSPIEISKSPPSRNLAHVPCKFFKQGACQAGNSCPFSHTIDATNDTAPCKYFQKGNCKFGVKCALAHILPDGRRVNPKTLAQVYQNHNVINNSNNGNSNNGNGVNYTNNNPNNNGHIFNDNSYSTDRIVDTNSINIPISNIATSPQYSNNIISPTSNHNGSYNKSQTSPAFNTSQIYQSNNGFYNSPSSQPRASSTFNSKSIWSNTQSTTSTTAFEPSYKNTGQFFSRSVSHSSIVRPNIIQQNSYINDSSAIVDDDDFDDGDQDEDIFEEDFVPSSLSDLLTPQELQRRGSRPNSSRPVFNLINQFNVDSHHTSTDAIIDPDESETQFRMDEDDIYKTNGTNGSNGLIRGIDGLTL